LEFSTVWNSFGSQVTIVEMLPHVAPLEDEEVSIELEKAFKKNRIEVLTAHRVQSVETTEKGVKVKVSSADGEKVLEAEQALVAIGFKPSTAGLGLETVGIKLTDRRHIAIDDHMATNVPGIYAIGDVTGKFLLAHVASTQGIIAAETIAKQETIKLDYAMTPRATYCYPQVASFGYTEAQAKEKGYDIRVGKFPFIANGKSLGLGETVGFAKIIVDSKYGEILGAHLIGPEVSELLPELTLAQRMEMTAEDIARNVHAHPTLSEVLMEAAHGVSGSPIHI